MSAFRPAYLDLLKSGELERRSIGTVNILKECTACPRNCRINRLEGALGHCRTGAHAKVSSYGPHFGEEKPLRGRHGSGTIFFSRCNLNCIYCQNYDISQSESGTDVDAQALANIMLRLQADGCHNINLVSPSHLVPQILAAIYIAAISGLELPIVYNSGGYDSLEMLKFLDGIIDIYMPDMKYSDEEIARDLSNVANYPTVNQVAVREMHRQVGDLQLDKNNLAQRGILVRHLVLPDNLAGSGNIFHFLSHTISMNTYLNIMAQYRPAHKAHNQTSLSRPITPYEYQEAIELARSHGLLRLDIIP